MSEELNEESTTVWPGGWYLYENGQFVGPLSAEDAFSERTQTEDGKPRLVSRKGFAQWYPHEDLASIFQMTQRVTAQAEMKVMAAESQIREQLQELERLKKIETAPVSAPVPMAKAADTTSKVEKKLVQTAPTSIVTPVSSKSKPEAVPSAPPTVMKTSGPITKISKSNLKAKKSAKKQVDPDSVVTEQPTAVAETKITEFKDTKSQTMHEYFLVKGRLRLGRLRNPWISGFLNLPLTLGAYWVMWIHEMAKEATFHAQTDRRGIMPAVMALIPGLHCVVVYQLAKAVLSMEEQNKYKTVNPWLAVAYSFFPPLVITYLQDAANRHWMLHVRHSLAKRMAEQN